MLSWLFPPRCPCDIEAKKWIEERLQWLDSEFGGNAFTHGTIILPTPEFFPDPFDGSEDSVRMLFDRVCGYMDVDPERVELKLFHEPNPIFLIDEKGYEVPTAAGLYEEGYLRFVIKISTSEISNPISLVGIMAHELAHLRLLGEYRLMGDEYDNELLTDLTVVHFGLGIFLANHPRSWLSQMSRWPGSKLLKPEYLTAPMYGWALAHLAWIRYLSVGARANMKQGLRYLLKTGDSKYRPRKNKIHDDD